MVAGTRAIEYIKEYNLLDRAVELGAYLEDRLREAADGNPFLGEVRGQGALVGAEFVTTEGVPDGDYVSEVQRRCLNKGVIVWSGGVEGNVLRLLPPLVMTDEQARVGMDIVVDTVEAVAADRTA
jgi:diaminobutyrate-2-oxoglutarate transaminase